MRIGLQTWGTDGDIRPFIALAGALSGAGHDVTLAVTSVDGKDYSQFARSLGFTVRHAGAPPEPAQLETARKILNTWNPAKQVRLLFEEIFCPSERMIAEASRVLCEECDVVVGHHIVYTLPTMAEKLGKPYAAVLLCHGAIPTRLAPPLGFPNFGERMNSFLWRAGGLFMDRALLPLVNGYRRKEGLETFYRVFGQAWRSDRLNLVAVGGVFCELRPDWDDTHHVCGFFNLPELAEEWTPPGKLADFLAHGPKPVYMTFGSMTQFDTERTTRLMVEAARLAGVRAIIQSDWDNAGDIPDHGDIYRIGKAPHSRVFPECAAVVHHGGSGTTQAASRAGVPSVVVEHGFDQYFWGLELQRLGMAGPPLHRRRVTAAKLANAIRLAADSESMRGTAARTGLLMRIEDGASCAVSLIEEILPG